MTTPRHPFSPTGAARPTAPPAQQAQQPQRRSTRQPARPTTSGTGGTSGTGSTGRAAGTAGATASGAGSSGGGGSRTAQGGQRGGSGGSGGSGGGPGGRRRLIDYPRAGRTGIRRWLPSWRLVLGIVLLALLGVVGFVLWAYAQTEIPTPDEFAEAQNTTVYFADGQTELGTFGVQNRVIVSGDQISEHMKDAIVAAEDRSFYENPGVDVTGIARAFYNNLRGGPRQGGSTITQQYAERYYFGATDDSYWGKFQEALLAVRLDRAQDKDEILDNYLNTIFFGRLSYGIETAAQSYFGVPAAELDVAQSALIAGIVPAPNAWDPRGANPQRAEQRWNYVMDGMVTIGALTQAERDAEVYPETIEWSRSDRLSGSNGYLLDMVRREIIARSPVTEEELDTRGYRITTTIDAAMQTSIVETANALPEDRPENLRVAMVSLDPADGAIRALYGGADFLQVQRNAVTQDTAQAGSTFKPFTLVAYLEDGGSLRSRYSGRSGLPVEGFGDGGVRNFGDQSFGEIDLVRATADSVNAVYAQMNVEVGPQATLDTAVRAGMPADTLGMEPVPANVLGTASPTTLAMAQAYNTLAAQGVRTEPHIVSTMEYLDGGTVYHGAQNPERAFDADVMADTTFALTQVVQQGSGGTVRELGRPVAGKTGTSNENRSAWFVGYVPQLTTAVALYQVSEDGTAAEPITPFGGFSQITGGSIPARLWTDYMARATEGMEVQQFPERADVGEPNVPPIVDVPSVTGLTEAEASAALQGAGFGVAVDRADDPDVPEGVVVSQNPSGQAQVGTTVTIVVSEGPGLADVPSVVGLSEGQARSALEGAGFTVSVSQTESSEPSGTVVSQDVTGQAPPGSAVGLVVSSGPPEEDEPDDPGDGNGGDGDGDGDGGGDEEGDDGGQAVAPGLPVPGLPGRGDD